MDGRADPRGASRVACVAMPFRRTRWHRSKNEGRTDRKSTRLNSSHTVNSYAVFCLKKKIAGRPAFRSELFHRLAVLLPILEVVVRRKNLGQALVFDMAVTDGDQASGVSMREQPHEHVLDEAEDRGVATNADGEREDHDRGRARVLD